MLDLRETVRYYLDSWHCKYALIGVGAVAIILKALKSRKMVLDGNTGLQPETMDEIKERDSKENPGLIVIATLSQCPPRLGLRKLKMLPKHYVSI
jgi:hypothetical protein